MAFHGWGKLRGYSEPLPGDPTSFPNKDDTNCGHALGGVTEGAIRSITTGVFEPSLVGFGEEK